MVSKGRKINSSSPAQALRPVFQGGPGEGIHKYAILKRYYQQAGLPILFAEPLQTGNGLDWLSEHAGPIHPYSHLSAADQIKAGRVISFFMGAIYDFVRKLPDGTSAVRMLNNCLQVPSLDDLIFIGSHPVLVNWGFLKDDFNPPSGLLHRLAAQIATPYLELDLIVQQGETARRIPDVSVLIEQTNETHSTATNSLGALKMKLVASDPVDLQIVLSKEGYENIRISPEIKQCLADMAWLDQLVFPVTIEMTPTAVKPAELVLACVDADTKQPLNEAIVQCQAGIQTYYSEPDGDGAAHFTINELVPDNLVVAYITCIGYADERVEFQIGPGSQYFRTIALKTLEKGGLKGKRGILNVNLSWETHDDLDLYMTDPEGNTIHFNNPSLATESCVGKLDLDANAEGSVLTDKPQENIYWEKALPGQYLVEVVMHKKRSKNPTVACKITVNNRNERTEFFHTLTYERIRNAVTKIDFSGS